VAAAATLLTILLAVGKGLVGHRRGSPALTADAVHSAADTLAILASWIGLQLSGRPPTTRFPFGLYRAETLAALLASGFILAAAVRLLVDSGGALLGRPQGLHHSLEVLGVALLSAGVSAGICVAERRAGSRLGSGSLLANADESRADILISLGVFAGAAASYVGVPRVEWAVTAVLAGSILWLGLKHGRVAVLSLMDASPDAALETHIATVAMRSRTPWSALCARPCPGSSR
jgi:cation diffusion facilitator family transporter